MSDEQVPTAPLLHTESITKEDGTPTEYFLRQWELQRGINTEIAGIVDLTARVDVLETEMDAVELLAANNALAITVNSNAITDLENIDLIAGTGLSGGGDLSGPDRTFNLEDTAVTPGTFGDATNVPQITIDQQGRITAAADVPITGGGGGETFDEFYFNVVMLMHFEGADASTTFTDSSDYAVTTTAEANAQIDTAQFKFGASSGLFDGTLDTVDWPDDSRYSLTDQDFTIEIWVRFATSPTGTHMNFASHYNNVGNIRSWFLRHNTSNQLEFGYYLNGITLNSVASAWTTAIDTWYHVAVSRNGADLRVFLDGVQQGATHNISTNSIFDTSDTPRIGALNSGGIVQVMDGWLDEYRWTIGVARYTADFTPQTAAWPDEGPFGVVAQDEGIEIRSNAFILDFAGDGVAVTDAGGGKALVTIPGGGGGGGGDVTGPSFSWPQRIADVSSGSSNASKGQLFSPIVDVKVSGVSIYLLNRATTVDYVAGVYRLDGSDQIDEITGVSASQAGPSNTEGVMFFELDADMVAGSRYVVLVSADNQADTFVLPIASTSDTDDADFVWYPGFPQDLYDGGTANNAVAAITLAQAQPGISDSPTISTSGANFGVGLEFTVAPVTVTGGGATLIGETIVAQGAATNSIAVDTGTEFSDFDEIYIMVELESDTTDCELRAVFRDAGADIGGSTYDNGGQMWLSNFATSSTDFVTTNIAYFQLTTGNGSSNWDLDGGGGFFSRIDIAANRNSSDEHLFKVASSWRAVFNTGSMGAVSGGFFGAAVAVEGIRIFTDPNTVDIFGSIKIIGVNYA